MTGLWIMSDLHVDAEPFQLPAKPPGANVLVIAGDVADGHHRTLRWLQRHAVPRGLPVVFVPGNHEPYGYDLLDERREDLLHIGVHLLEPHAPVELAGVRFVGGTLWTDYAVAGDRAAAMWWAKQSYPDFWNVDVALRRLRPEDLYDAHRLQRAGIEADLAQSFNGPTVVVTHHAPHPASLKPTLFPASNGSFASDLSAVIHRYRPALWIHGHLHQSHDYIIGSDGAVIPFSQERYSAGDGTRIVCNPRGYAAPRSDGMRPGNSEFLTDLVIEI